MPSEYQTVSESYPSLDKFEDLLEEAIFQARNPAHRVWLDTLRKHYKSRGGSLKLSQVERLRLRQLATGAIV